MLLGGGGGFSRSVQIALRLPTIGIVSRRVSFAMLLGGCGAFSRSVQIALRLPTIGGVSRLVIPGMLLGGGAYFRSGRVGLRLPTTGIAPRACRRRAMLDMLRRVGCGCLAGTAMIGRIHRERVDGRGYFVDLVTAIGRFVGGSCLRRLIVAVAVSAILPGFCIDNPEFIAAPADGIGSESFQGEWPIVYSGV